MFQLKEQDNHPLQKNLNESEISNLHDKVFKIIVIKIFSELGRKMNEHSENINKGIGNIGKYQTEVTEKNKITELKNNYRGSKID